MDKKGHKGDPSTPTEPHAAVTGEELDNGTERPGNSSVEEITEQSSYRDADAMLRQTLRGDESRGDADERDIAGATEFNDTPHGREEAKNDKAGAANQNG